MKHDKFSHSTGNRALGWRTIKKGGIIKWDGRTFQDDRLVNLAGEKLEIQFVGENVFADGPIKIFPSYGGSILIEKSQEKKQLDINEAELQKIVKQWGINEEK